MPELNNFQHSKYSRVDPGERVSYPTFSPGAGVGTAAWNEAMEKAGNRLAQAGVRGVVFVSGLPYADLFGAGRLDEVGGLRRGYSRGISGLESLLALLRPETNGLSIPEGGASPPCENSDIDKRRLDALVGDLGNFSDEYVETFGKAINARLPRPIPCTRYLWSSLHHHAGRIEGALRLMEFLNEWTKTLGVESGDHILVQAHGQAGLLLALVSNFLAPDDSANRRAIFQSLARHYERVQQDGETVERLERLFQAVTSSGFLQGAVLDVVTLGTMVRYGWDTGAIGTLVHVVNHRPIRGDGKRWLAKMELPQIAWEMPLVAGGDYVQQLAVAGTDAVPGSPSEHLLNQELQDVLEPYDGFEKWLECARRGTRCQNDGKGLLVDYGVVGEGESRNHLYGHGCYTKMSAMLFNTLQIVDQLPSPSK